MVTSVGVRLAGVALVAMASCSRGPDYEALCEVESRCTGQDPGPCVAYHKRAAARLEGCDEQEAELVACMLRDQGTRCETEGGARLRPSVLCDAPVGALERCQARPEAGSVSSPALEQGGRTRPP